MELRLVRSFIAAAEDGNISKAAARLRVTQPALSRQIKTLEDDLGVSLLERGAHSFSLTPAGELLLREGRALLERAELLEQRVQAAAKVQTIRVGYSPSLTAGILAPAMEAFSQLHPKARVELSDLSSLEMVEGLHKGALDVIVTVPPAKIVADTVWITVQQQGWRVAMPRQHPLAVKATLTPRDLHDQRLVVYNQREYPDYWASLSAWFTDQGISARIASECDGVTSLISAVEAGLGIALVVERIACLIPERIDLKPLKPQPAPVCIAAGMPEKRRRDKVLGVFVEELKRAGAVDARRR
jgi:LysR family transcriptional regulator, benzoate and cis,cis-muconate-responsive activator of ben and cat genes